MTASTPDETPGPADSAGLLWLPTEMPVLPASAVDTAGFLVIITEAMTAPITEDSHHGWCRIGGGTEPAPGVS